MEQTIHGRVATVRRHGAITFATLAAGRTTVQIRVAGPASAEGQPPLRPGQIVSVSGVPEVDGRGEFRLLATSMTRHFDPPHSWRAPPVIMRTVRKSWPMVLQACRRQMEESAIDEAITPVLFPYFVGGASVPLSTSVRGGRVMHLRVTSEVALKAQVSHTLKPTYEIGAQFRNTPPSRKFGTEFVSLEAFLPFSGLSDGVVLLTRLIGAVVSTLTEAGVLDRARATLLSGVTTVTVRDLLQAENQGADRIVSSDLSIGMLERLCERHLRTGVGVVMNLPAQMSPLYRSSDHDSALARRAWVCVDGLPVADLGEEEYDAVLLREALSRQEAALADEGALQEVTCNDALLSIAQDGQPPMVGLSLGLSRLVGALIGTKSVSSTHLTP